MYQDLFLFKFSFVNLCTCKYSSLKIFALFLYINDLISYKLCLSHFSNLFPQIDHHISTIDYDIVKFLLSLCQPFISDF